MGFCSWLRGLFKSDAHLMPVIWEDGHAVYEFPGAKPLAWEKSRLPLTYYIGLDAEQAELASSVRDAADLWNREVGRCVFTEVVSADRATVIYQTGSVSGMKAGGTLHFGTPDLATGAIVSLAGVGSKAEAYLVAMHEWGHVLGLGHERSGIMQSPLPDLSNPSSGMPWLLPTDADVKLVRSILY